LIYVGPCSAGEGARTGGSIGMETAKQAGGLTHRGPLGWFGAVDVGRVGHGGHAWFFGHARERLGRDGRIVAAVGGEVRCDVAFVVPAGLGLAEAGDEGVDLRAMNSPGRGRES
jgi:hypothetical protein